MKTKTEIRNKAKHDLLQGYAQEEEEVYVAQPDGFVDPDHQIKFTVKESFYMEETSTEEGSWTVTALSSAEAEQLGRISTIVPQSMWMRTQLQDYASTTTK
ncbi:hypothetical protein Tco_0033231 [Tanacetum coccineum]